MFCNKCGTKLEDDVLFCSACGAKVHQEAEESEGLSAVSDVSDKKQKNNRKPLFVIVVFLALCIVAVIIFALTSAKEEKPVIGEWELTGILSGDEFITLEQLKEMDLEIDGHAFFDEENFSFSVSEVESTGTWEEVEKEGSEDFYCKLVTADGGITHASVAAESPDSLFILIPNSDNDRMLIYTRVK